jgi:hypothetical protein
MSTREVSTETKALIRAKISNAYYDARNLGRTMEQAADDAVAALAPILLSCDDNAHRRGMTEVADRLTDPTILAAFKEAWHSEDDLGNRGSRVLAGMEAVAEELRP